MQKLTNNRFFPYGTQYYRAPTPLPGEWEKDLENIAKAGYTHIQFRPQWRTHERIFNSFVWDDLDQLFDLAQKFDLRVVLKPMLECAPDWVFTELDGQRIGFSGRPIPPIAHGAFYVGGWLPCFDNPKVSERAAEFAYQCAARYKDHPALWFYDAWNEPRSRPAGQCHCSHSRESYRNWLRQQFGSIEKLNAEYSKAWTSFDTVMPPESATDHVELFIWRQWAAWAVSEHVRNVTCAIKKAHPEATVLNHIGVASVIADSVCDTSDDILNASASDFYGTSFPVNLHPENMAQCREGDLIGDWLRRVDPQFWIHEFYPSNGDWTRPCEPDMLRFLVWQGIATGTSGFTYWQWRSERVGNEANGYGLREVNGDSTLRSDAADTIAAVLRQKGSLLAETKRRRSPVAMLYSKRSDLISRIQSFPSIFMADSEKGFETDFHKNALKAAHVLYDRLPEGLDFITEADDISQYKCIIIVTAEMLSADFCAKLKKFVEAGGNLILEYPVAVRDENTWLALDRPTYGIAELSGFREKIRWAPVKETAEIENIKLVPQWWYIWGEIAEDAEIIGTWDTGKAAAIRRKAGTGTVTTLLASPSLAFAAGHEEAAIQITGKILNNIFPDQLLPKGLEIRTRESADHKITLIFNTNSATWVNFPTPAGTIWDQSGATIENNGTVKLSPHGFAIFGE